MRGLGSSASAAVLGAVLAGSTRQSAQCGGPTESAFVTSVVLGLVAALLCLLPALFIPRAGAMPLRR
jgi:hypothetical protein